MKKILTCAAFLLFVFSSVFSQFFLNQITTPDGSVDFLVGVKSDFSNYIEREDGSGYTTLELRIINQGTAQELEWNDFRVYILLDDDSSLFYNYRTAATEGEYACDYTVASGATHYQLLCFEKQFKAGEIKKVWLSTADNEFFELYYSEAEEE